VSTQTFLHYLWSHHRNLRFFGIVDYDPDGLNIMHHYRKGPRVAARGESLAMPGMTWLGIHCRDMANRQQPAAEVEISQSEPALCLTSRDRTLARGLIGGLSASTAHEADLRVELQCMLMLGYKAEIQSVDDNGDLSRWAEERLGEQLCGL